MGALRRRLQSRLPYNVYWFCYKRSHLEQLPQWLKISPDVHFVVPPVEVENKELSVLSVREAQEEDKLESLGTASMERTGKPTQDSSLTAQQVLDGLIERCGLKAPELTLNPLGFFAKHLKQSLPDYDSSAITGDIYFIRSVIDRIEQANTREKELRETAAIGWRVYGMPCVALSTARR